MTRLPRICRLTAALLGGCLLASGAVAVAPAAAAPLESVTVVLRSQAHPAALTVHGRASRLAAVERLLRDHATRTQRGLRHFLAARAAAGSVSHIVPLWIANEIDVSATPAVIAQLAARPDVQSVEPQLTVQAPAAPTGQSTPGAAVEPNISLVGAPAMWDRGFRGQGVVVANMDTGVDATQPDLAASWRGGTDSWYDPNGEHPTTPTDVNGHGTWTMGVMVGGSAGGSAVGMAPGAKWIAVKIFNDRGTATTSNIHLGYQWLLDPDGDPATPDAPNVVNNSWTMSVPGCDTGLQLDLQNLRAAGILPVFAAGNDGPTAGSVDSPANLPEAFAVGGTDDSDQLDPYSSRGPSACAGATAPAITAPDTNVRTTDLYGGYATETGTSVAAPHASGALALLLSALPGLSADRQQAALQAGAHDLGPPGPDQDYGYGRLDVDASYRYLTNSADFGVRAAPTSATVPPGTTASYQVTVDPINGFTGDVTLSVSAPFAADVGLAPATLPNGSGTSTLSVTPTAAAAPGTYAVTVNATSGAIQHTATASITVQPAPSFTLAVSPSSRSVAAGGSATFTATVTAVNGFSDAVTLGASGPPPGAGVTVVSPTTVSGAGSATVSVRTATSAPPGSYPLTISASAGVTTRSVTATLVVTAAKTFAIAVTPASVKVARGGTAKYSVAVSGSGGFTGSVSLSASKLPPGASASFSADPAKPGATVVLRVRTSASTPRRTFTITITGTSGGTSHRVSAVLAVN